MNAITLSAALSDDVSASPAPVDLARLFPDATWIGAQVSVGSAACHSERVVPGGAFAVIDGLHRHGREYVPQAIHNGARVLLVDRPLAGVEASQCVVADVRRAYSHLCAALHGNPARRLAIAGITGTNGKTSVTWLLRSILQADQRRCGLLGTIHNDDGVTIAESTLTTPEAADVHGWLERVVDHAGTHVVLEVSSHALDQQRLVDVPLDAAVITNITQDHFDYHGTREAYVRAKSRIAALLRPAGRLVLNAGDAGALAAGSISGADNITTFAYSVPADYVGHAVSESTEGSRFVVAGENELWEFHTPLVGRHQIENCLAAIAAARQWGIGVEAIQRGIAQLRCVPGRLQSIENDRGLALFVDYAHTPDALERSLAHLRRLVSGRLIVVFGAGGDRDRSKRPLMGRAACAADMAIVTSDNPRSEGPDRIIDEIFAGMRGRATARWRVSDRREAIRRALSLALPGDAVLVAGKGHETVQVIGKDIVPFDDVAVVRECLATPSTHAPPCLLASP